MVKFNDFPKEAELRFSEYDKAFRRVLHSGWYILGEEVKKFEGEFSEYLKVKYCIGVGNGLEALQISLMALGIGKGDEVITTPLSAVATTLSIIAAGAKPVFVDANEVAQINADLIEKAITKKTKAVMPVHLYGQPAEIDKIKEICKKHDLFLIEDTAQAHGSICKGKILGTFGDVGCFSFYPTKNLGAFGDAGAIVTNNKKVAKICAEIRDYGQESKYVHLRYGLNSRLDELQATLLRVKLKYLNQDNRKKRKIAKRYIEKLKNIKGLKLILPEKWDDSNFHQFVIKTSKRDELRKYLATKGIPTLIHFPVPIPDQPFLKKDYGKAKIPVCRMLAKSVVSLPCHIMMTQAQVDEVVRAIKKFFEK
ncbi:DegT/DnrJ/EryC1/StrS family aminotransferase [Patescibacteria group bacterium]|nr:DegT/DnrJ/EryC1/StrS family aminotransferase [Patescibacteria group bacterium]